MSDRPGETNLLPFTLISSARYEEPARGGKGQFKLKISISATESFSYVFVVQPHCYLSFSSRVCELV